MTKAQILKIVKDTDDLSQIIYALAEEYGFENLICILEDEILPELIRREP